MRGKKTERKIVWNVSEGGKKGRGKPEVIITGNRT